jgi:YaaC-like Protein
VLRPTSFLLASRFPSTDGPQPPGVVVAVPFRRVHVVLSESVRTITTENPGRDVRRYLRHWTNKSFVEERLARRHTGLTADQRRRKSREVAVCVQQGLEYLATSEVGSPITSPLPLFYAAENFAKGTCVFFDPSLHADDFKAHGLKHDSSKRYSIKNLAAEIQKPGRDVWSRYLTHGNTERAAITRTVDGSRQIADLQVTFSPKRLKPGKALQLGQLLRSLPELVEDLIAADWDPSYTVHVSTYSFVAQSGPPPTVERKVRLRHRKHGPTKDLVLSRQRTLLKHYNLVTDSMDILHFEGTASTEDSLGPLRTDMFGQLYMDMNQSDVDLAEPLVYLASLFILSSAVRYEPEQWQRLLEDHPAEAILIDRMLEVATRKLPNLVLNKLHGEIYRFKVGA